MLQVTRLVLSNYNALCQSRVVKFCWNLFFKKNVIKPKEAGVSPLKTNFTGSSNMKWRKNYFRFQDWSRNAILASFKFRSLCRPSYNCCWWWEPRRSLPREFLSATFPSTKKWTFAREDLERVYFVTFMEVVKGQCLQYLWSIPSLFLFIFHLFH